MALGLLIASIQVFALIVVGVAWLRDPKRRLRARLRLLPVRPLGEASSRGSAAALVGRVQLDAATALRAPFSGRECAYWRVTGEIYFTGRQARVIHFESEERCDFWVKADERRARVVVHELDFDIKDDSLWSVPEERLGDLALGPSMLAVLERAGITLVSDGLAGIMVRERVLRADERVRVAGRVDIASDLMPGGARQETGYREAAMAPFVRAPGVVRALEPRPADLVAQPIVD